MAELGDQGDAVAREITIVCSAESLAGLAASVIDQLHMKDHEIPIAKAGGATGRSKFFDAAIDEALQKIAPRARITSLQMKPAEAAAPGWQIRLGKRRPYAG